MLIHEKPGEPSSISKLKFPNVRLHLHDLLAKHKLVPSQAMAQSAVLFGLIPECAVPKVLASNPEKLCLCMSSALAIIDECVKTMTLQNEKVDIRSSDIWAGLTKDAQTHLNLKAPSSENYQAIDKYEHDCSRFAPTLFDLMLQQLQRYPGLE